MKKILISAYSRKQHKCNTILPLRAAQTAKSARVRACPTSSVTGAKHLLSSFNATSMFGEFFK